MISSLKVVAILVLSIATATLAVGSPNSCRVEAIADGGTTQTILFSNGVSLALGENMDGQAGVGLSKYKKLTTPQIVPGGASWISIARTTALAYWVKNDGTLWAAGDTSFISKTRPECQNYYAPKQIGTAKDWKSVTVGSFHALGLKKDGSLYIWGQSYDNFNTQIPGKWTQVCGGKDFSIGIKDGKIYGWGNNIEGQLGSNGEIVNEPTLIDQSSDWESVACGLGHVLAVKNGKAFAWGGNDFNQLGDESKTNRNVPTEIVIEGAKIKSVVAGNANSFAMTTDGTLYNWGMNGFPPVQAISKPTKVAHPAKWKLIATKRGHITGVTTNDELYLWGDGIETPTKVDFTCPTPTRQAKRALMLFAERVLAPHPATQTLTSPAVQRVKCGLLPGEVQFESDEDARRKKATAEKIAAIRAAKAAKNNAGTARKLFVAFKSLLKH